MPGIVHLSFDNGLAGAHKKGAYPRWLGPPRRYELMPQHPSAVQRGTMLLELKRGAMFSTGEVPFGELPL